MENAKIKTVMNVVTRSISEHVLLHLERYSRKVPSIIFAGMTNKGYWGFIPLLPAPFPSFFRGLIGVLLQ